MNAAVTKAEARGHSMAVSTRQLASGVRRWECLRCGAAVIDYDNNQYGLALERDCGEAAAA